MTDPELARQIVMSKDRDAHLDPNDDSDELEDDSPGWAPQYREYDLHAKQLGDVINTLAALNQTVRAAVGAKARAVDPYPVPRTAVPRAEADQARADGDAILDLLGMRDEVPGGAAP